ncbi:MAG: metallophosphoesterase [Candidatus Woesearchaeota archaeon]
MKNIEITENIILFDHFIFIKKEKTLILSDLHIGLEEVMHKEGFMIPKINFLEQKKRVALASKRFKPKKIILNGDIKHEFGNINREEWKNIINFLEILKKKSEIIIIEGNHDKIIRPIAIKKRIKTSKYYISQDKKIFVCHGDIILKNDDLKKSKYVIIGHVHPAITLYSGFRNEKFKCFLVGNWKTKKIIVMPSLNFLNEGCNILREKQTSPFLKNIKNENFEVYIVADKIYGFGKLSKF